MLLGRPRGSKGEKVTKNMVRDCRPGTCFGAPFGQKSFFYGKVRSWSVFFASRCFYLILDRFLVDFRRPGTTKTQILAWSGIEIKKITKLHPEPPQGQFWEAFWLNFRPL